MQRSQQSASSSLRPRLDGRKKKVRVDHSGVSPQENSTDLLRPTAQWLKQTSEILLYTSRNSLNFFDRKGGAQKTYQRMTLYLQNLLTFLSPLSSISPTGTAMLQDCRKTKTPATIVRRCHFWRFTEQIALFLASAIDHRMLQLIKTGCTVGIDKIVCLGQTSHSHSHSRLVYCFACLSGGEVGRFLPPG